MDSSPTPAAMDSSRLQPTYHVTALQVQGDPLLAQLAEEMAEGWRQGECPLAEEFFARHQELLARPEAAARLIYEEICLRQACGQEGASIEVARRFPQWRPQLEGLLCRRVPGEAVSSPEAGESWGGFRLLAELGRGGRGRVFLASEAALADRPVVLKITPCDGREHLALARLQHTHIVPLYSVQDDLERNLRTLCMPYFGGVTLDRLLFTLQRQPPGQRSGQQLLSALDQAVGTLPVALPARGPARQFLSQRSYVDVVCWIGSCLADALHYAHERGLVHLDVKPSNVLLATDGQPMLLDFHLAQEALRPEQPAPRWLGGTAAYMSPEQKQALVAVRERRRVPAVVDGRSDIYSLGLLLYEALGGTVPIPPGQAPSRLRHVNPQVSVGLQDLLDRCLQPDVRTRYENAATLAADLRRHLTDMPLQGVANRSWRERWHKWRRRKPHALRIIGLHVVLLLAAVTAGALGIRHVFGKRQEAAEALPISAELIQQGRFAEARRLLERACSGATWLLGSKDLEDQVARQLHLLKRAEARRELRHVADRLRFDYDLDCLPYGVLKSLEASCRSLWERRAVIAERLAEESALDGGQSIRTDLLDLSILWADLRVRLASKSEEKAARQAALQVLAEAEELFGSSVVLQRERQIHAEALGRRADSSAGRAAGLTASTAWEHYALGRSFLRAQELERADEELEQAVLLQPHGLWPNFYYGICCHRRKRFDEAVKAFSVCIGACPRSAQIFYNRALAYSELGQNERALPDYGHALELDPTLAAAAFNRGILHFRQQRYPEAVADLELALSKGADPATVHYNLALVYVADKDQERALASARRALEYNVKHKEAKDLLQRLSTRR